MKTPIREIEAQCLKKNVKHLLAVFYTLLKLDDFRLSITASNFPIIAQARVPADQK